MSLTTAAPRVPQQLAKHPMSASAVLLEDRHLTRAGGRADNDRGLIRANAVGKPGSKHVMMILVSGEGE